MSSKAGNIFIVGAKRTAFGSFGGTLRDFTATDLAEHAARAALASASVRPEHVDHIIFGNTNQTSKDAAYLARHVGLRIGLPDVTPAVTVNRLCGSSFQSIIDGAYQIIAGDSKVVIAGGAESMSGAPFAVRNIRWGTSIAAKYEFEDCLTQSGVDWHIKAPMPITAEKLGAMYKLTRAEVDEYALTSQTRTRLAANAGYFNNEIVPIQVKTKKGPKAFDRDEHPRETSIEQLSALKPVFQKDGLVTAGNASGIGDGAGAVVLASEEAVNKYHLTPLVRIVGWDVVGCDPTIMGIGPVPAIRNLCKKTGVDLNDVEMVEVNEAFAAQTLVVQRELKIEKDRLNVNGGAIALGHPLGASGARISAHLSYELKRRNARYGIGSACIGGGQGIAILFEKV